jgi:hypothetical protein
LVELFKIPRPSKRQILGRQPSQTRHLFFHHNRFDLNLSAPNPHNNPPLKKGPAWRTATRTNQVVNLPDHLESGVISRIDEETSS